MKKKSALAAAIAAALLALAACLWFASSSANGAPSSREELVLGTRCVITAFGRGGEQALDDAFARLRQIDRRMSANRDDSEVSAVSAAAGQSAVKVSPDTLFVLETALDYSRKTGGIFDPSIGPLVRLWGIGTDAARLPSPAEIAAARALTGWKDVAVDHAASTVFLKRRGMRLDLGANAKGYAGDEVCAILRKDGIKRAIVDLGGNICVLGEKAKGAPWRIGIQTPDRSLARGTYFAILPLSDSSLVTSGPYERYFEKDGKVYHHILDPFTGYPSDSGLVSATVLCPSSIKADCLSTSIFALGREAGMALARSEGVECVLVDSSKRVWATDGIRAKLEMTDGSYSLAP